MQLDTFIKKFALFAALSISAHAVEVEYHGDLLFNTYSDYSKAASDADSSHNVHHDIALEAEFKYNEGVSLTVGVSNVSLNQKEPSKYPRGPRPADEMDKNEFVLDDVHMNWEFIENGTVMVGRFLYDAGSVNSYRPYGYQQTYSPIFTEKVVHGVGLRASDFVGYIGLNGETNDAFNVFLSYDAPLLESRDMKLNVQPIIDWRANDGDGRKWHLALDNDFSSNYGDLDYSIHNIFSYMPHNKANDNSWNFLLEPNLEYKGFGLGLGYYFASPAVGPVAGTKDDIGLQTDMPVQEFWYMEPFIPVSPKWAVGFPVSHHDVSRYVKNDHFWEYGTAIYAYPTNGAEIGAQVGYKNVPVAKDYFFTELYAEFSF